MRKILSFFAASAAATPAFAHEGHGHTEGFTITHYFTEPEHAIPLAAALVLAIILVVRVRKAASKK